MKQLSKFVLYSQTTLAERDAYITNLRIHMLNTSCSLTTDHIWKGVEVRIHQLSIVQLCRRNLELYLNFVGINHAQWNVLSDMEELSSAQSSALCHNPVLNNLLFYFDFEPDFEVTSALQETLKTCEKNPVYLKSSKSVHKSHISEGYGSVMLGVMGNFSYVTSFNGQLCNNGEMVKLYAAYESGIHSSYYEIKLEIKETFVNPNRGIIFYPVVIRSVHPDLKLVICGYQGFTPLLFVELLNVFDKKRVGVDSHFRCYRISRI